VSDEYEELRSARLRVERWKARARGIIAEFGFAVAVSSNGTLWAIMEISPTDDNTLLVKIPGGTVELPILFFREVRIPKAEDRNHPDILAALEGAPLVDEDDEIEDGRSYCGDRDSLDAITEAEPTQEDFNQAFESVNHRWPRQFDDLPQRRPSALSPLPADVNLAFQAMGWKVRRDDDR
jgi:hypothetical protein